LVSGASQKLSAPAGPTNHLEGVDLKPEGGADGAASARVPKNGARLIIGKIPVETPVFVVPLDASSSLQTIDKLVHVSRHATMSLKHSCTRVLVYSCTRVRMHA
jgi:hypothetical protein